MANNLKARPINPEHSINEVVFVLEFPQQLSPDQLSKIAELEVKLHDDLPKFDKVQAVGFQVQNNKVLNTELPTKLAAVSFKKFTNDSKLVWSLRAENNFIIVNCASYTRWAKVWPIARNYLQLAAELVMGPDYPIQAIVLQYIDRFVFSGNIQDYSVGAIFDENSVFLPSNVLSSGTSWHVHQGWFDETQLADRKLNRINIDVATDVSTGEHLSTIDHQGIMQFRTTLGSSTKLFDGDKNEASDDLKQIDLIFNELHTNNKTILNRVLNDDMQSMIELNS